MNKILAGLIFLLVKINLNLFGIPITIFPDFVAYIFIYFGLLELSVVTPMFKKSLKPAICLIFYNLVEGVIKLLPSTIYNGFSFSGAFKLVSGLTTAYIFYIIILGLREYQKKANVHIETSVLKRRWTAFTVTAIVSPFFRTLTYNDALLLNHLTSEHLRDVTYASVGFIAIAFIYGVICWIVLACFTAEFNKVRAVYNESRFAR